MVQMPGWRGFQRFDKTTTTTGKKSYVEKGRGPNYPQAWYGRKGPADFSELGCGVGIGLLFSCCAPLLSRADGWLAAGRYCHAARVVDGGAAGGCSAAAGRVWWCGLGRVATSRALPPHPPLQWIPEWPAGRVSVGCRPIWLRSLSRCCPGPADLSRTWLAPGRGSPAGQHPHRCEP